MRIVVGGIAHETSTFTPVTTTLASYEQRFLLRDDDILTTFRDTNTVIGGFIDGANTHSFDLVPTLYAVAHPSGPTPRDLFDRLLNEMLQRIADAGDMDGVLLALHGSMVVGNLDVPGDGLDDAEGHLLAMIRQQVGEDVPIIAQLDIHSNVTPQMVEMADVLIGRETYPEIDMADRGRECADVMHRILEGGLKPTMALYQIPMVWGMNQVTAHPPMRDAIAELHRVEAVPKVVCGSIAVCYFLADVPHMGSSVYVVTDDDYDLAQQHATELGQWAFDRRADWHYDLPTTQDALELAQANDLFPVIFADSRDNPGGGSPGDSTGMMQTFIDNDLQDACVLYMIDPEAIAQCHAAGVGATIALEVGAKSSPLQGKPIQLTAEVVAISNGNFHYDGPMYEGLAGNMGKSAYIRHKGVHIILVTVREQPFDTAFARTLGLDPRKMKYIGVKSTAHFRAGFEAWAGAIHLVNEPGVHNLGNLPFKRLGRQLYPFDDI